MSIMKEWKSSAYSSLNSEITSENVISRREAALCVKGLSMS